MPEPLCGICGIAADRILARTDAGILAVPADTARDGHVMVVSATHARSFTDLPPHHGDALMSLVASATRAAEEASGVEKCYVLRIGDKHPHLHFHIVPAAPDDPPLGPHIFGDRGWSSGVKRDALPSAAVFEPAFGETMKHAIERSPSSTARLPPFLVGLSISLMVFAVVFAIAWPLAGESYAGPISLFAAFAAGQAADDRMKGIPIRWRHAIVGSSVVAAAVYLMSRWL